MCGMVVTLDVSKLSGWLNAFAYCRVERAGMRCGKRCGPGGVRALGGSDAGGMHGEGPTQGCGRRARAERTPNMWYMVVTLDVSKLSGWLNADATCRAHRRALRAGRYQPAPLPLARPCVWRHRGHADDLDDSLVLAYYRLINSRPPSPDPIPPALSP